MPLSKKNAEEGGADLEIGVEGATVELALRKEVSDWPTLLSGIAGQASGHKIVERVVAAFCYRPDIIQGRGELGQLFFAIAEFFSRRARTA
jgi:hypothetical protein